MYGGDEASISPISFGTAIANPATQQIAVDA